MSRFIIVCAARTGSTMLRHWLNQHEQICCHGEVMGTPDQLVGLNGLSSDKTNIRQYLVDWKRRDPIGFVDQFLLERASFTSVGFKLKYEQWILPEFRSLWAWLLERRDIHVVHLVRRDKLRRYVSHQVAVATGVNVVLVGQERPAPRVVTIDPADCLADMRRVAAEEIRFRTALQRPGFFELEYETLLKAPERTMAALQTSLGAPVHSLSPVTVKLGSDDLESTVANFSELRRSLAGTEFEDILG